MSRSRSNQALEISRLVEFMTIALAHSIHSICTTQQCIARVITELHYSREPHIESVRVVLCHAPLDVEGEESRVIGGGAGQGFLEEHDPLQGLWDVMHRIYSCIAINQECSNCG